MNSPAMFSKIFHYSFLVDIARPHTMMNSKTVCYSSVTGEVV